MRENAMLTRRLCGRETGGNVDVVVGAIVVSTVVSTGRVVSGVVSEELSACTAMAGINVQTALIAITIRRGRIMMLKG